MRRVDLASLAALKLFSAVCVGVMRERDREDSVCLHVQEVLESSKAHTSTAHGLFNLQFDEGALAPVGCVCV